MKKLISVSVFLSLLFLLYSQTPAEVPQMINYQGKLTTEQGGCLNDTVSMTFTIYSDDQGRVVDWTEDQDSVIVKEGIFNVLLGSASPIPASVFDGSTKYLGVQVESDPEMRPLKPMVSVAYAYRAGMVDGGSINCEDCDERFVNVQGPDSVMTTSGTAFLGKASGSTTSSMSGIKGYANNTSSGTAYGVEGWADNASTGYAFGGYFRTTYGGTGQHYGIWAAGYGSSSYATFGCYGSALNTSTGMVRGGAFRAEDSGTGQHEGVFAVAYGSSSAITLGCIAAAHNTSTGDAYGGDFTVGSSGTGTHCGVMARGSGSSSAPTYGYYGLGSNSSTGDAYGGCFVASSYGTGTKYGVFASALADEGYAGYFQGDVTITDSLIVLGAKSAAVKTDNGEYRLLYCQESPENWFEDFGEGRLIDGKAVIQIDPLFAKTVNTSGKYHVFVTPHDEPLTLAVANKTATSFEVIGPARANISFSYRIVAKRKGYENIRLAKMGGPTPEKVAAEQEKFEVELEQERVRMEQERQKMEEERMEMEKERELR